jgi:hypothetical protein
VRGDPLIQGLGPHPEAAATSSRGGDLIQGRRPHPGVGTSSRGWDLIQGLGPHPGVGTSSRGWDLIQGLGPLIQGRRRIAIESSVDGLFLNKSECVFAKWLNGVEYLC